MSAVDAVSLAVSILEDCPHTNAGIGSNLTLDGKIECDASLMESEQGAVGIVGSVSHIRNPINIARLMVQDQFGPPLPLNRLKPLILVGKEAEKWAKKRGIPLVSKESMITKKAQHLFNICYKSLSTVLGKDQTVTFPVEEVQDTVGAIALDSSGTIASGVSSGGLVLKQPGRVGQAGSFGSGCWAEKFSKEKICVGTSTSGSGEYLLKTLIAQKGAECIAQTPLAMVGLSEALNTHFLQSKFLQHVPEKDRLGGMMALKTDEENGSLDVVWGHTTLTMGIGYMSSNDRKPKARISKLPHGIEQGHAVNVEGQTYRLF